MNFYGTSLYYVMEILQSTSGLRDLIRDGGEDVKDINTHFRSGVFFYFWLTSSKKLSPSDLDISGTSGNINIGWNSESSTNKIQLQVYVFTNDDYARIAARKYAVEKKYYYTDSTSKKNYCRSTDDLRDWEDYKSIIWTAQHESRIIEQAFDLVLLYKNYSPSTFPKEGSPGSHSCLLLLSKSFSQAPRTQSCLRAICATNDAPIF